MSSLTGQRAIISARDDGAEYAAENRAHRAAEHHQGEQHPDEPLQMLAGLLREDQRNVVQRIGNIGPDYDRPVGW